MNVAEKKQPTSKNAKRASGWPIERAFGNILISRIWVGIRRREKVGSIVSLMSSFERVGQLEMIVVRPDWDGDGFELVAGWRRLRAAEALGWTRIQAIVANITDKQLRDIELDETMIRLDLTELEASEFGAVKTTPSDPRQAKSQVTEAP